MDEKALLTIIRELPLKRRVTLLERLQAESTVTAPDGLVYSVLRRSELDTVTERKPTEQRLLEWIATFEDGEVLYDIGAGDGALSMATAAAHEGRVTVVATEPSHPAFASLLANLTHNGMTSAVMPLHVALADHTGLDHHAPPSAGDSHGTPTYTLDDLIDVMRLPLPTRLKVDLHDDLRILHGARLTLRRPTLREISVALVDHDGRGTRLREIETVLVEHGLRLHERALQLDADGKPSSSVTVLFRRTAAAARKTMRSKPGLRQHLDRSQAQAGEALTAAETARRAREEARLSAQTARLEAAAHRQAAGAARSAERSSRKARPKPPASPGDQPPADKAARGEPAGATTRDFPVRKAMDAAAKEAAREATRIFRRVSRIVAHWDPSEDPDPAVPETAFQTQCRLAPAAAEAGLEVNLLGTARQLATLASSYYLRAAEKKVDLATLPGFADVAAQVIAEGRTYLAEDRLHTLWQGAVQSTRGHASIEVGAYQGGSAKLIAEALKSAQRDDQPLYVCDTFTGHAAVDPALDAKHRVQVQFLETSAASVTDYLGAYDTVQVIAGDFVTTSSTLPRNILFGFVHIDVDVHGATAFCLDFFADRLAPGALVVVDDYGFLTCPGATKAVDDFIARRDDFRMLHLLTGQAVLFQVPRQAIERL